MKYSLLNYSQLQHKRPSKFSLLVNLRWAVLALMSILLCVLMLLYKIDRYTFASLCLILIGVGVFNSYSISKLRVSEALSEWDIFFNILFDLSTLTICISICGGLASPFTSFLFIYFILGGVLLESKQSALFFLFCLLSILFLWWAPLPSLLTDGVELSSLSYFIGNIVVLGILWPLLIWIKKSLQIMERNLSQISEQLHQADRLKAYGLLSAGLSHELATPLNTILLKVNRLKRDKSLLSDEDIDIIDQATTKCLRSLGRIQQISIDSEEVSFEELNAVEAIRNIIRFKGWNLKIETKSNESILFLPMISFSQIFVDLLENAIEASGEEGTWVEIIDERERLEVKIYNHSQLDPLVLRHFGEPFVTTKEKGTGLGLYNAKIFLDSIGASLTISNETEELVCTHMTFKKRTHV
ncbi:putative two component system, histidine kinase [Halobacteriovorax marinus SJ]|uniref:histidine kinase n=1 Tax=Halobacteriovorax marinus (strain ATCC BAA-682 / DSM 15412 / SJ) TaxID=862908 RepID=E1X5B3_HALMS|nr:HAMP domain-containing sensor histidine kinase [Halobacteriovorax marinus]CBW25585.1 putative two component system, histidine kinase [Halobacteriovorax marinus SJ]